VAFHTVRFGSSPLTDPPSAATLLQEYRRFSLAERIPQLLIAFFSVFLNLPFVFFFFLFYEREQLEDPNHRHIDSILAARFCFLSASSRCCVPFQWGPSFSS